MWFIVHMTINIRNHHAWSKTNAANVFRMLCWLSQLHAMVVIMYRIYNEKTLKVKNTDVLVDNSCFVPSSLLFFKTFKVRCNIGYYDSVKSIKYVCMYVNKRKKDGCILYCRCCCQQWLFAISDEKICQQQWGDLKNLFIHHILCAPGVYTTHLFYGSKSSKESWTITSSNADKLFVICASDPFVKTMVYLEMPRCFTWNA